MELLYRLCLTTRKLFLDKYKGKAVFHLVASSWSEQHPESPLIKRFRRKSAEWSIVLIYIDYVPKRPNNVTVATLLMAILKV